MARDYSSRHNGEAPSKPSRAKTNRRTPAARPVKPKKPARSSQGGGNGGKARAGTPGWVWGLIGLFAGIVLVSGYYIFARPAGTPGDTAQLDIALPDESEADAVDDAGEPEDTDEQADQPPETPAAPEEKPRFSFYKMLPNYHVDVSEGAHKNQAAAPAANEPHEVESAPTKPRAASRASAAPERSAPARSSQAYVIQAGAFSSADDADRRKAQLALLGVTANVSSATSSSGKTIYRVQSTRVDSAGRAQELSQRLQSNGIETMIRQAD